MKSEKLEVRKTNTLQPALRFPEFREEGEWNEETIKEMCKSFSGGTPNSTNKAFYGGKIPFIRSAEIGKEQTALFLTQEGFSKSAAKIANEGDVLVALYGANSGDVSVSKIKGAINQAILCLRSKGSNAFLCYYLTLKKAWILENFLQGGQGNLSGEIIKSVCLRFPKPAEQQKIADCLGSLDGLIAAHSRKLDALQDHKKGLLQNLFPAQKESEKSEVKSEKYVPKLRFPEFEHEWCETELGNICSITTGRLDANAMVDGGKYRFYTCAKDYYYINDFSFDTDALLISGNGANVGYVHHYKGKFNAYQRTYVLDDFSKNIIFMRYFLDRHLSRRIELEKKDGNTPYIVKATLADMTVIIPKPAEQQKIADCLTSLDALITAQTEQIAALKAHKKGLMQQLFPHSERNKVCCSGQAAKTRREAT